MALRERRLLVPPLKPPSAYVTFAQKTTWSNNQLDSSRDSWRFSWTPAFSNIVSKKVDPERPFVQLKTRTRIRPLVMRRLVLVKADNRDLRSWLGSQSYIGTDVPFYTALEALLGMSAVQEPSSVEVLWIHNGLTTARPFRILQSLDIQM